MKIKEKLEKVLKLTTKLNTKNDYHSIVEVYKDIREIDNIIIKILEDMREEDEA